MTANRVVFGFIVCLTSFCLSGWSLVLSAAAATIVVTTDQDSADPPFDTGGLCGSGTVADLPGADGKVSLREAIIAANNTPGSKTIKFAPSLKDKTIVLTGPLSPLCGGHTTLNGDVDGDQTPDVTLDGGAVLLPFDVIMVVSSHNMVKNLRVLTPSPYNGVWGVSIRTALTAGPTVVDNTVAHNTVSGAIGIFAGGLTLDTRSLLNDATIKHTIVRDNTVMGSGLGIVAFNLRHHNVITDLTIAGNMVSGTAGSSSILIMGGISDSNPPIGATDDRLDVTISDNTLTGNSNPGDTAGIAILGGFSSSSNNHVIAQIFNNTITDNNGHGVSVGSGLDNSSNNNVEVTIRDNTLENNSGLGIVTYGGIGALFSPSGESSGNRLDARIERNTVKNASLFGLWVFGGLGGVVSASDKLANHNEVNAIVKDNTITGTLGEGMHLAAGSAGEANDNEVDITVQKNTVCDSNNADIHAVGGLLGHPFLIDNTGTGNELEGKIIKNTADSVVVEDGVAGNTANIAQVKNTPCP